ncbi:EamA family transporter [Mesorhizobium retamae]|uniref:EamA family transporter n=1 Tax=Mesorhizobium retamae TaxID=2912854 RepID=A0ABS9QHT9_9HYPH|nr:EamA family transporter [Mesorhizobium sp. IRAMC:0171]MCG7507017.1 EamA family transporter [Mesorhizobium sp. IRAMC:0171]
MSLSATSSPGLRGIIAGFVVVDTATQIAFKWASERIGAGSLDTAWLLAALTTPALWLAVFLYALTFVLWMLILARMDLGRAFPLSALTYVTVPAAGMLLFGEHLTWPQTAGIALIISGVLLIGRGKPE